MNATEIYDRIKKLQESIDKLIDDLTKADVEPWDARKWAQVLMFIMTKLKEMEFELKRNYVVVIEDGQATD